MMAGVSTHLRRSAPTRFPLRKLEVSSILLLPAVAAAGTQTRKAAAVAALVEC
jgi:hypothetical protein